MSRRRRSGGRVAADERKRAAAEPGAASGRRGHVPDDAASAPPWWRVLATQIGVLAAVFGVTVVIAELAGAANLGVSLGIGQIVFAVVLMYLLLRR